MRENQIERQRAEQAAQRQQQKKAVARARLLVEREASRIGITPQEAEHFIRCGFTFADLCAVNGPVDFLASMAGRSPKIEKTGRGTKKAPVAANERATPWGSMASVLAEQARERRGQKKHQRSAA